MSFLIVLVKCQETMEYAAQSFILNFTIYPF